MEQPLSIKHYRFLHGRGYRALVDSGPARKHMMYLHEQLEMTFKEIHEQSGVRINVLTGLHQQRRGRYQKIRPGDAAALLAFRPRPMSRAERMLGTGRILKGLSATGVSTSVVAEHLGTKYRKQTLDNWRMGYADYVPTREVYDELVSIAQKLERMTPAELGMKTNVYNQVRARSRTYGYAPIAAWDWDTIHLADAFPDWTGACGSMEGLRIHRRDEILPICEPCQEARRVAKAERKARNDG